MIVIEGPDLAGKTTLATALFKMISAESGRDPMVRHFTKVTKTFDKFWGYKNCIQRDVILDRFHLSDVVYRAAQSERHDLTPFKYELIDAEITRVGGVVVVLVPSDELMEDRWNALPPSRTEMYSLEQNLKIRALFEITATLGRVQNVDGEIYAPKIDNYFTFGHDLDVDAMARSIMNLWVSRQMQLDSVLRARPMEL